MQISLTLQPLYKYFCLLLIILLDQVSKCIIAEILPQTDSYVISVLPFFDIVHVWNYGISFGLFRGYYQYSNYFFLCTNGLINLYLLYMIRTQSDCTRGSALYGIVMITGGGIGNLIDRIFRGAVYDFIYFHYEDIGFPAFNIADAAITVGAFLMMYQYLIKDHLKNRARVQSVNNR